MTRGATVAAAILLCAAGARPAPGGTIRDDRDPLTYVELGASPSFASVGRIDLEAGGLPYSASGTLIAPRWVLTAAHVVDGATSLKFAAGDGTYEAERWVSHPKWSGRLRQGYDLALVKLAADVPDVAPAALYDGAREHGAVATLVGFGRTGTGLTGHDTYDGLKRAGQNAIDGTVDRRQGLFRGRLPKSARLIVADFDNPADPGESVLGSRDPLDLEYLTSPGDSGGALFVDIGGTPALAGVHSFAEALDRVDDASYGDVGGAVRVSRYIKWINTTMRREDAGGGGFVAAPLIHGTPLRLGAAADADAAPRPLVIRGGGGDGTSTVAPLPEPGGMILGLGAAAFGITRRRKRA